MEQKDDSFGFNIYSEINLILSNIPNELNEEELLRWIYIKFGNLFSYDYRISSDIKIGNVKIDFSSEYISNYQTCTQICEIMNKVYNSLGFKSKTITRNNGNVTYSLPHTANMLTLSTGERYILDLTVDLHLIQSGSMTKHFAMSSECECDVMSESKIMAIDESLGLVKYGEYMDKIIQDKKEEIDNYDYSLLSEDEILMYKINQINKLIPKFEGYNEGRLYVDKLFGEFGLNYNRFNLYYKSEFKNKFIGCFCVYGENNIWYLYAGDLGLIKTEATKLKNMINNGWSCKKSNFLDIINEELQHKSL